MSEILKEDLLPVLAARERIETALAESGMLILSAPPGTGKSTQVPKFLLKHPGQIVVLQPRRIAARALAARIADEMGEPLGKTVGYQVRFENVSGPETRLLFQTYGTFRQRILREPDLPGVQAVVLDEFHERAWEADLALLWCRELKRQRRIDLCLIVMSATLDAGGLEKYLPTAAKVSVEGKAFPVEIRHQPARAQEYLPQQVLRSLKSLAANGWSGSALVFLPGAGEIRQTAEQLSAYCREAGLRLCELHGSLPLNAQQEAIRAPSRGPSVVLTTNVAETSLTVPGITAVIDAGLHRVAAYDPERDLNTLYLQSISLANAIQRAGRAGRVAPGTCIRLWDSDREKHMAKNLEPEMKRVELSEAALALHALLGSSSLSTHAGSLWPTPPDPALWKQAEDRLEHISALHKGFITPLGKSLLAWPAAPVLARVLHDAAQSSDSALQRQVAAMAACLSSGKSTGKNSSDLFILGEDLIDGEKKADKELSGAFRQFLERMRGPGPVGASPAPPMGARGAPLQGRDLRHRAVELFLPAYVDRLAARMPGTQSFALADGRRGVPNGASSETQLILALEIHESGGKDRIRQTTIPLFLPVEPVWVEEAFPGECAWQAAEEFDAKKAKVIHEDRLMFRGLVLDRRERAAAKNSDVGELLVEQILSGEITLPLDEEAQQWVYRIQLAHRICPEKGIPALDEDDWKLIYHDICEGKKSVKQLEGVSLSAALRDYLGWAMTDFLEREAPAKVKLPGKRDGKITYFEKSPPELSARLGDLLGMQGRFKILMGRVDVTYDILAPNYRTVQKTSDLTSFWQNAYPEVKKELKRRYPRHPWP